MDDGKNGQSVKLLRIISTPNICLQRSASKRPHSKESQDLWNDLEECYRRTELARYCKTTPRNCKRAREFVDRIRLLDNQLNAIARGSIGDEADISMTLTQIGGCCHHYCSVRIFSRPDLYLLVRKGLGHSMLVV